MEPDFWHARWAENQIGFHQPGGNPALFRWWPSLDLPADAAVFVPLCGKTPDMSWLAERGHPVLGVELSEIAVADFFREQDATPTRTAAGALTRYAAGNIALLAGDFFAVDAAHTAAMDAVYDRAALIALPPAMREAYVRHLAALLRPGARGLLISIDYPPDDMDGPPFPVPEDEIRALLAPWFEVTRLATADALAASDNLRQRGLSALYESVYALTRRQDAAPEQYRHNPEE